MIQKILCLMALVPTLAMAQDIVVVSAATFLSEFPVAPDSIASAFGSNLAPGTEAATITPLPISLQGTSVTIVDAAAQVHECPLFFVSPGQINFLIPAAAATGTASIRVGPGGLALQPEGSEGGPPPSQFEIAAVSTGLFNVTELEWLSGFVLKVDADGTQTFLPIVELQGDQIVPVPLQMSPGGDESASYYIVAYGTGNRGSGDLEAVHSYIGFDDSVGFAEDEIPTLYNGPQGDFVGLDQTNAGPISRSLEWFGGGDRAFALEVDGDFSNLAWLNVAPNPNAPVITNPSFELEAGSPPRVVYGFDYSDADGDLGPLAVFWEWEDATRFCQSSLTLGEGPSTGQTSGRLQFFDTKGFGVQLGPIESVSFYVADSGGHVSNEVVYVPDPPGSLGGFAESCDQVFDK